MLRQVNWCNRLNILAVLAVLTTLVSSPIAHAKDDDDIDYAEVAGEVNIYSYRKEALIRPLLDAFSAATGIAVNLVSGNADMLLERLKNEGRNSPADLLLTTDAGRLIRAQQAGVLQAVSSPALRRLVPAQYRDPDGFWYGLSLRARVIFYARDRVDASKLSGYAGLADEQWRDRICVRSSNNIYNQSMLASMIARVGVEAAEQWATAVVANFARKPQGGDTDQIRAVAAGQCDLAIANSYYFARMLSSSDPEIQRLAAGVGLFWPDQRPGDNGTHVNISGAAVTASATNKAEAIRLIEWLASDPAQKIYAETVFEYPLRDGIVMAPVVAGFGTFRADDLNLGLLGKHNSEAVRIFDRADWR